MTTDFKEFLFLIKELKDKNFHSSDSPRTNSSIFNKANVAVLNFPVLCSDSISLKELMIVNKALERNYCSFVRIAMGLDNVITTGENVEKYIRKFHTNDLSSKDYKPFDNIYNSFINDIVEENNVITNEDTISPFTKNEVTIERLGLNKTNLNKYTLNNNIINKHSHVFSEAKKANYVIKNIPIKGTVPNLVENDVKKANELVPTTFEISLIQKTGENSQAIIELLLGIKTTTHLVQSNIMIENLTKSFNEKKGFFRFIQWTTGEIKFFKDYLLCLDNIKDEVSNYRKNKLEEGWFRSLKNRATLSKLRSTIHLKDTLIPNSTIVLSMDEVDYIRNMYDIDFLRNYTAIKEIMKIFFLIGFVIVDSASETMYFYFDGSPKYQIFTYKTLERENKNTENELKALVSLMGR